MSKAQDSPLASAARIKAIGIGIGAALGSTSPKHSTNTSSVSPPQASSLRTVHGYAERPAVNLLSANIRGFISTRGNPEMGTAKYEGQIVFVEWKELPVRSRNKIMGRVKDLAVLLGALKHPEFRSFRCKGIALDSETARIAFVFEMPAFVETGPPKPLRTMFGNSPSVTERLQLALRITESVRYFHMAGWLHKNLRSENILLSSNRDISSGNPLANPILAGFAFSRLDSPSEISEQPSSDPQGDIYRHPDAMGEPSESFSAIEDIYALGTVLLEIGEWRSLRSLVERIVGLGKSDIALIQLARIRSFLLDDSNKGGLGNLKFRMGDVYTSVMKRMLSGEMPKVPAMTKEEGQLFAPDILGIAMRELSRCVI